MKLENVKLFIWDLDDTIWKGTLSEEEVFLCEDIVKFIQDTLDRGIVHSICSKNDFTSAKNKLQEFGIWEYFVFPSINWESKGNRVKKIISQMNLRSCNVVFVDDNIQNLREAQFVCPDIMTLEPKDLYYYYDEIDKIEKSDIEHKRLEKYRNLQEKVSEQEKFSSNTEFLYSCNIKVELHRDCENQLERISELVSRTNQLNYTKKRQTRDELEQLFKEPDVDSGYVTVKDRFGDYGIVGFWAVKNQTAIHFLFSCRTLGMSVEQYVYREIGCPKLHIVEPVAATVNENDMPDWINQNNTDETKSEKASTKCRVLLKGPCDMEQIFAFIEKDENIFTEFSYVGDNGSLVEGYNSTPQIVTMLASTGERKQEILSDVNWFDSKMLESALESTDFSYVVFSMLTDGNLGFYQRNTGEVIALCEKKYDLTNPENWNAYIESNIFTSGINFKKDDLQKFSEKYKYVSNADGSITLESLQKIWEKAGNTKIILLLGSERKFPKQEKPSFANRHEFHHLLNQKIKAWAENKENVILLCFDDYIKSDSDYLDTINHFTKRVYFAMAEELIRIINGDSNDFQSKGRIAIFYETIKAKIKKVKLPKFLKRYMQWKK